MKNQTNTSKDRVSSSGNLNQNQPKPKESRLSMKRRRGPTNPNGKVYQRSEKAIRRSLFVALSKRYLGVQAKAIFRAAHVTAPTFYAHNENVNAALINCETDLEKNYIQLISKVTKREMAWTIMLTFLERNRDYFRATTRARDFYLLQRMIDDMRPVLIGTGDISKKSYNLYIFEAIGIIDCWMRFDNFDKNLIDQYVKKLAQLRFMRF